MAQTLKSPVFSGVLRFVVIIQQGHTYAAEKYQRMVEAGIPELTAHFEVSKLLGHERPDVTDIYLASVRKGGRLGD